MREIDFIGMPLNLGARRQGVEQGTEVLRQIVFGKGSRRHKWNDKGNIECETIHTAQPGTDIQRPFLKEIVKACQSLAERVEASLRTGHFPFIAGGDHALVLGSLTGVLRCLPQSNLVYIDAHADLNPIDESASHNLHGVPLAYMLGLEQEEEIDKLTQGVGLLPAKTLYLGTRSIDPPERRLIRENHIHVGRKWPVNLKIDGPAHISFDIDALDPQVAPGTGVPETGGLSLVEGLEILEAAFANSHVSSFDLVEINPLLDIDGKTMEVARQIVGKIDTFID